MLRKIVRLVVPLVGLAIFAGAIYLLTQELRAHDPRDVIRHVRELPLPVVVLSLLLSLASYVAATGYDVLGARYALGRRLPYFRAARASFAANAIANSAGFGLLTGVSVRYRMYSTWGLAPIEIGKIIAFYTLSLWLGFFSLGGLLFTVETISIPSVLGIPIPSARPIGIAFLCLVAGYAVLAAVGRRNLRVGKHELALPGLGYLPAQIAVGVADWGLAGLSLYAIFAATTRIPYGEFMAVYVLALIGGVLSQVPGGLGVFETVFVLLLAPRMAAPQVLGALIVYRGVYFLVPLVLGVGVLAAQEIRAQRERLRKAGRALMGVLSVIAPRILAVGLFGGGVILLLSGATPAEMTRLRVLREFVPLPFIEVSHFLGSMWVF